MTGPYVTTVWRRTAPQGIRLPEAIHHVAAITIHDVRQALYGAALAATHGDEAYAEELSRAMPEEGGTVELRGGGAMVEVEPVTAGELLRRLPAWAPAPPQVVTIAMAVQTFNAAWAQEERR